MNKQATLFLVLLAFAFNAAQAVTVSQSQANSAAKAWVARGGMLGAEIGAQVEKVSELTVDNGEKFYAVKMTGKGTLFMSSDTDYSPVIAFTSSDSDYSTIDPKSPLWSLLNRDVSNLSSAAKAVKNATASAELEQTMKTLSSSVSKLWSELIAEGENLDVKNSGLKFEDPITSGNPGDLRVGPLVKSQWSQSLAKGMACWNYYTPNGADPSKFLEGDKGNAVCGCVATAMAQIMRYHTYPVSSLETLTRECFWDNTTMKLTTQGGVYDWEKMTPVPNTAVSFDEENCKAIGKLVSDAGISVYMQYTKGSSGAFSFDISGAMKNYWKYGSAVFYHPENFTGSELAKGSRSAMYSNFDAGLPVFMGIPGHQIVADGYGWNNEFEYVHLNMGWAGQDDFWYNLPDMTKAGANYNAVDDLVYNVIPYANGQSAVISGRTLDEEGNALAKSLVGLYQDGVLVTQVVASAQGVWGVVVDAGTYSISAVSEDGIMLGEIERVQVIKPSPIDVKWNSLRTVPTVRNSGNVGNSWGNDITLSNPSVRVGDVLYTTLDKALAAATNVINPVVEIVLPTELRKSVTVDFNCTIVSVGDNPADTFVVRHNDAVITVGANANVEISNLAFSNLTDTASSVAPFKVDSLGKISVAGDLDFGVENGKAAIVIADADAFTIAGVLEKGFAIDCKAATTIGQTFGFAVEMTVQEASDSAEKVVNVNDEWLEIRGKVEGDTEPFVLRWDERTVPFSESACYYVDDAGNTNTSARIDRLIAKFQTASAEGEISPGAEIVVRKSGSLKTPVTVSVDTFIRGENGAQLSVSDPATFKVNSGKLVVQGLGFKDYKGNALFYVNGGELVLSNGVSIVGAVGTNYHSGAVAVMGGTATLGPEITIKDCSFAVYGSGNGAGVYVNANATLNFLGGTITGCLASGNGGAIYVNKNGKLNMQGEMNVFGNRKYSISTGNDIYLPYSSSELTIMGPVSGKVGILYGTTAGTFNKVGGAFAKIASGLSDKDIAGIARNSASFVCDSDLDLRAAFSDDQKSLVWSENAADAGTVPENLIDYAYARVVEPGLASVYYWSVADAFAAVKVDGTLVEMLKSDSLSGAVAVTNNNVTLAGVLVDGLKSGLSGGTLEVSGSLALTNLVMSGENLLKVDGGMLYVDDAIESPIGCVGGTKDEPMLFAEVRASLAYDSLTNSAANFRNSELDAYGVAVTNESRTLVVWSRAIAADGTFTGVDGTVWGCVGEVPVYEIEVRPDPIAFKEISRDETDGSWNLTLTNLVKGCWYSLYSTNSLAGGFLVGEGVSEPVTNFQAEADGEFIFKAEGVGEATFWKVVAEPGTISE